MIEVEHLTRRYGDLTAVNDISFRIGNGEVVGLLGHNGAGKTTIMKMITGYLEPTGGSIRIDGRELGADPRPIQRRIGYLPENCPLWPEMTVIDYLDYQAALHGVPPARRSEIYELLGLINEQLWLGHFDLWSEDGVILFRHASLMGDAVSVGTCEELIDIAISTCERFYPAFQFVLWGGKSAGDALVASLIDTVGEA